MLSERVFPYLDGMNSEGLNPCFNGICSLRLESVLMVRLVSRGLNPCFNGICSLSFMASDCEAII